VKKESAESEPAWQGAGQEEGLQIWRINKFKVEHWPKEEYGEFFNGDSYIILNTYKLVCHPQQLQISLLFSTFTS
jgi:gelsolin